MPKSSKVKTNAIPDMTAVITQHLIDPNPLRWQQPYMQNEPNIFYISFHPRNVEGKANGLTSVDAATQQVVRKAMQEIPSYANVELIEHDDWPSLPVGARKILIAGSSDALQDTIPLITLRDYQAQYEGRVPKTSTVVSAGSFTILQETSSKALPDTPRIVDAHVIILPDNFLRITGEDYTVNTITVQLFKTIGLQAPCESFLSDLQKEGLLQIREGNKKEYLAGCNQKLSPYTIMTDHVRMESIEDCMRGKIGWDFDLNKTDAPHQRAFIDCAYSADNTVKTADKEALTRILGPVPSSQVRNAISNGNIFMAIGAGLVAGVGLAQVGVNKKLASTVLGCSGAALLAHGLQEGNPTTCISGIGLISSAIGIAGMVPQVRGGY